MLSETIRELRKLTSLVSSEYAGNEFHFRLRIPDSELQGASDTVRSIITCMSNQQVKMRKENGAWQIYVVLPDYEGK